MFLGLDLTWKAAVYINWTQQWLCFPPNSLSRFFETTSILDTWFQQIDPSFSNWSAWGWGGEVEALSPSTAHLFLLLLDCSLVTVSRGFTRELSSRTQAKLEASHLLKMEHLLGARYSVLGPRSTSAHTAHKTLRNLVKWFSNSKKGFRSFLFHSSWDWILKN